jgi:hypothetical protein
VYVVTLDAIPIALVAMLDRTAGVLIVMLFAVTAEIATSPTVLRFAPPTYP